MGKANSHRAAVHWCPSVPGDGSSAAWLCLWSYSPLSWCPRFLSPLSEFFLPVCSKARGNIWLFGVSLMPRVSPSLFCWVLEACPNSPVPSLCLLPNPDLLWGGLLSCPSAAVSHCPPPGFPCSQISAAWLCPSSACSSQGSFLWLWGVFPHSLPAPEGSQIPSGQETS